MDRTPVLQVRQLRYRWPGQRSDIVQLQDLSLGAGERMLVHGDSGSGKSTLLSLAADATDAVSPVADAEEIAAARPGTPVKVSTGIAHADLGTC